MSVDTLIESLLDAGSTPAASIYMKQMKKFSYFLIYFLLVSIRIFPLTINIRTFDHEGFTRIVFEGDSDFSYTAKRDSGKDLALFIRDTSGRLIINSDLSNSSLIKRVDNVSDGLETGFRVTASGNFDIIKNFILRAPFRVVFDIRRRETESSITKDLQNSNNGESSNKTLPNPVSDKKQRRSTIDVVCIDPGHGGSDLGAVGPGNTNEKDITLKVGKKLKMIIERELGIRVVMTRDSDVEIALDSRVAKANNQNAQLFLSIHVNSSYRKSARGPETYFVSLKATDKISSQLAMKENNSFNGMDGIPEDDDLKMILWSMAQTEFIRESSKLADYIQNELNILMNTKNRGVKQAPFRVLMRASMPAVLIEIAFVSNKYEESKLKNDSFLSEVAQSIYNGVSKFIYDYNSTFK